jgi:hypothetical protein
MQRAIEMVVSEYLYLARTGMDLRWYQRLQSIKNSYIPVREPSSDASISLDSVSPCGGVLGFEG